MTDIPPNNPLPLEELLAGLQKQIDKLAPPAPPELPGKPLPEDKDGRNVSSTVPADEFLREADLDRWFEDAFSDLPENGQKRRAGKPPSPARKLLKIVFNSFFWLICIAMVTGSVLFAVNSDPRKSYFNYRFYNVLTESMTPDENSPPGGFGKNAVILIRMCKPEEIKAGEIITFNPDARDENNTLYLTHRVVEIKNELGGKQGLFFVTRGDANHADDPPISGDMVIGKKVFHIPKIGGWLQKVREHFVLAIITVVCFFACILMFRWYFTAPKQTKQPGVPELGRILSPQA